jgi:hypothetical protein
MRNSIINVGEALYGPRFQRELAKDLGVNERTMRRWIAGTSSPPSSVIADLRSLVALRIKALAALMEKL